MTTKTAPRRSPAQTTFLAKARDFLLLRHAVAKAEAELKALRPELMASIDRIGVTDPDKGHVTLEFGEVIEAGGVNYCALQNQMRRAPVDQAACERILSEHRLVEHCADQYIHFAHPERVLRFLRSTKEGARLLEGSGEVLIRFDPARIEASGDAGELTAVEVAQCIPITWALVPVKAPAS